MSYISWDKKKLVNLEFTLNREVLRSNALGAFLATTVIGCNTRKYHGLLVVPQPITVVARNAPKALDVYSISFHFPIFHQLH